MPNIVYGSGAHVSKMHNLICTIRPFNNSNYNKALICVITPKNGNAELFQRHVNLSTSAVFLIKGDISTYDNAAMHVSGVNYEVQSMLTNIGVKCMLYLIVALN